VVIHIEEHAFFTREDDDLTCQIPISFVQAALGDTYKIPLLAEETHELNIRPGTQPGDILKIPGKGMPSLQGFRRRGDVFVKIVVKIPEKLEQHQRELLEAFAETEGMALSEKKKKKKHLWEKLTK
jgi:molecular chaperone DnaJ